MKDYYCTSGCNKKAEVEFKSKNESEGEKNHRLCLSCGLVWALHSLEDKPKHWSITNIRRI